MARQQTLALLPPPTHADTEVTTNVPCKLDMPSLKKASLSVSLAGTPSNNVEVALGNDADQDGRISLDEQALLMSFDCGEWSVSGPGGAIEPTASGTNTNGVTWAELEVDIRKHKSNPRWLFDETWNLVRVTRRGVDDPQERVAVGTRVEGLIIMVK